VVDHGRVGSNPKVRFADHPTLIARASLNSESNCRPGWGLVMQSDGSRELQCLNVCLGLHKEA